MASRKMHQTTVRFGPDLWAELERQSAELGVSVAQFVRESALARLMFLAGQREDSAYGAALELAEDNRIPSSARRGDTDRGDGIPPVFQDSAALWAQGRQVRRRSRELRDQITRTRTPG